MATLSFPCNFQPLKQTQAINQVSGFAMDEIELVRQLKADSTKAFDEIYALYARRLYAYCLQYVKSREDAEEIVQDVFTKVWINRHSIVHAESIGAFIFKIAKNQLINKYRQRINSFVFEEYVNYYNEEKYSVCDTSHVIEYDDFRKSLDKALKNLTSTQQKVIVSCKLNQLSVKEVAQKLHLQEQTVKNALSAGLKILRETLKTGISLLLLFLLKDLNF